MMMVTHRHEYTYPTVRRWDSQGKVQPIWGLDNRKYRYIIGLNKPNYPVPARVYHFNDPLPSFISNGDITTLAWSIEHGNTWFE